MRLHVSLLPDDVPQFAKNALAVVVDTFRFTTAACEALANGATELTTCASVDSAKQLAKQSDAKLLLCGERECKPIPGFDFGNSPLEYSPENIAGQQLIFTTTNGTRAVQAAHGSVETWLAALTNRKAVCQAIAETQPESLWVLCSGTNGEPSLEDIVTAGALLDHMDCSCQNDAARLARFAWQQISNTGDLQDQLQKGAGGSNVVAAGYTSDIEFAARLDSCSCIPSNAGTSSKHTFRARNS